MSWHLITPPATEPLTLTEMKAHLRVTIADDDTYITSLITAVRIRAERATRRALITQTWDIYVDAWPTWSGYHGPELTALPAGGWVWLPKAPLQSVTYVQYIALDGTLTTWDSSNYLVDAPAGDFAARGRLGLGWVKVWPIIRPVQNAICIRAVCGYGNASAVPMLLKQAMLADAGTLYENRSTVITGTRAQAIRIPDLSTDIYRAFRSL